jgi:hypothetical protein
MKAVCLLLLLSISLIHIIPSAPSLERTTYPNPLRTRLRGIPSKNETVSVYRKLSPVEEQSVV